jgi:hypothetical protein
MIWFANFPCGDDAEAIFGGIFSGLSAVAVGESTSGVNRMIWFVTLYGSPLLRVRLVSADAAGIRRTVCCCHSDMGC